MERRLDDATIPAPDVEPASDGPGSDGPGGLERRRFIGYLLAGPTLAVAVPMAGSPTAAAIPSPPQPSDLLDLNDILTLAAKPTSGLVKVVVNEDGTASFDLPRAESGQGVSTSSAMIIAEELDLPLDKIIITLADARPELLFNQFTAGSNTTISTYEPFRAAAALARQKLIDAAAKEWGVSAGAVKTDQGVVIAPDGRRFGYGELAKRAASSHTSAASVQLKKETDFTIVGTEQRRMDARDAVTGKKQYAMDLDVPDALPTMICRAPTINGTVQSVQNQAAVEAMPGITDVVTIPTGVAVRGETFGQCVDAVRALEVTWGKGSVDEQSDDTILEKLRGAQLPLAVPEVPGLAKTYEAEFVFHWKSNSALEPQTCVADVRKDGAEIWSAMQTPILAQQEVAKALKMTQDKVKAHCVQAGGAFGRRMFTDVCVEAALISQKIGKPVKLMWHRTDEFRFGRVHPLCTSRIRATQLLDDVLTFEQRHTSVSTDYTQGFGEILTATASKFPAQNFLQYSNTVFQTTAKVPYNVGVVTQLLNEIYDFDTFRTSSVRNLYSPDVVTSVELMMDEIGRGMNKDPYELRKSLVKDKRARAVLDKVAEAGNWGRSMPDKTAQGIALHLEYKGAAACLVEIDCRPETVNRPIRQGVTGPRVTKVVFAVDVGRAINPLGLKAQMEGGIMSGVGEILTESLHLVDGNYQEGSWDDYHFTRHWNAPLEIEVIVMPPTTGKPGGAGEFGVGVSKAAVACAYGRAVGKMPTSFPINHEDPLTFEPKPRVPPIPESPTNGLDFTI